MTSSSRPSSSCRLAVAVLLAVAASLAVVPLQQQQRSVLFVRAYAPFFVASPRRRTTTIALGASSSSSSSMRMDLERPETTLATARWQLDQLMMRTAGEVTSSRSPTVDEEQAKHGMPWRKSIDSTYEDSELLYMKFWEWHLQFMKDQLTNLKVENCRNDATNTRFDYRENSQKKARITSLCLSSDEYRKIRLTYYDAGNNAQVFNAVLYPRAEYDLPILGVDVLAFNRKKYLAIVDFQPLHPVESDHAATYEHLLQPIKAEYDNLKGQMSSKFYDETQFFSKQMLFSRFEDEDIVHDELFPAFQQYVQTHLQLVKDTTPNPNNVRAVMERQEAYDTYSAERDPATGLFAAMFGADWAHEFVHDFLFSLSHKREPPQQEHDTKSGPRTAESATPSVPAVPKTFVNARRR